MLEFSIRRPDDWHLHLRDGDILNAVLPYTSQYFQRAIVMPNLRPPVSSFEQASAYYDRIMAAVPAEHSFQPLMTLYLTENIDPKDVKHGIHHGLIKALKLYPAGATTNSDAGVRELSAIYPTLEVMQQSETPLLIHGEVVDPAVDIFDREARFIEEKLIPLRRDFPSLKIVFEHITTVDAVNYVTQESDITAATITPHHLVINRNAMLVGGIRPHNYCLPVAKREVHRLALVDAATSGSSKFFLGTDSAPHPDHDKETDCGCAGVFNAATALPILAHVFEQAGALDKLEGFTSIHGPAFYGLEPNTDITTLKKLENPQTNFQPLPLIDGQIRHFMPPFDLFWAVV